MLAISTRSLAVSRFDSASTGLATMILSSHARRLIISIGALSTGASRLLSSARAVLSILLVNRHKTSSNTLICSSLSGSGLESHGGPVQVVRVGALDPDRRDLADAQRPVRRHVDGAVDLGRIALAAALGDARADLVDDDLLARADLALETLRRDPLLAPHEAVIALGLDRVGNRRREIVRGRAAHRLVFEAA